MPIQIDDTQFPPNRWGEIWEEWEEACNKPKKDSSQSIICNSPMAAEDKSAEIETKNLRYFF